MKNLPPSCNNKKLQTVFSAFGQLDKAYVLFDHKTGSSRGFGFVEYLHEIDLEQALENPVTIDGKVVHCSRVFLKQETKEKGGQQAKAPICQPTPSPKVPREMKNEREKERIQMLSNGKVSSAPDVATQDSLGNSSEGEWEKDQNSPMPDAVSYQALAHLPAHRGGRRFFSCEQWQQYSSEPTHDDTGYPYPFGPVGAPYGNAHVQAGYVQDSYIHGPQSVPSEESWGNTSWCSPHQAMGYSAQPELYASKPKTYYRMF